MSLSPGQGHYVLFSGKAPLSLLMYLANCQVTRVVGGGGGGVYIVGVVQAEVKKSLNIYRTLK